MRRHYADSIFLLQSSFAHSLKMGFRALPAIRVHFKHPDARQALAAGAVHGSQP